MLDEGQGSSPTTCCSQGTEKDAEEATGQRRWPQAMYPPARDTWSRQGRHWTLPTPELQAFASEWWGPYLRL